MSLPDCLIAGVPKAGTTALRSALRQHPELYLPKNKEPKFFLTGDWTHLWSAGLEPIGDLVRVCEAGQRRIADGWGHFWHYTRGPAPRSVHIAQAPARRPDRAGRGPTPARHRRGLQRLAPPPRALGRTGRCPVTGAAAVTQRPPALISAVRYAGRGRCPGG